MSLFSGSSKKQKEKKRYSARLKSINPLDIDGGHKIRHFSWHGRGKFHQFNIDGNPRKLGRFQDKLCDELRSKSGREPVFCPPDQVLGNVVYEFSNNLTSAWGLLGGYEGGPDDQVLVLKRADKPKSVPVAIAVADAEETRPTSIFGPLLSSITSVSSGLLFVLSLALYALSFTLPAFVTLYQATETTPGYLAFLIGPLGIVAGHLAWFANPLLWFSWATRMSSRSERSFNTAILAFVLAASFLFYETVPSGSAGDYPFRVSIGYFVWLASIGAAALSAKQYSRTANNKSL